MAQLERILCFAVSWRRTIVGVSGLIVILAAATAARAQQSACDISSFLAVSSWSGTVTITGTGSGTFTDPNGNTDTYNIHQSITLAPVLTPPKGVLDSYSGPENAVVNINDQYTSTTPASPGNPSFTTTTIATANGASALGAFGTGAGLTLSPLALACGYSFTADISFSPDSIMVNGVESGTGMINWGALNLPNLLDPPGTATVPQTYVPFPTSGTVLAGSTSFNSDTWEDPLTYDPNSPPAIHWTVSWKFFPTPAPLDLILTSRGYQLWRPTGGLTETDLAVGPSTPPNLLDFTAQLVFKDTQQPTPFGPDQITFKLTNVSHEPGVAMNWPAKANLIKVPLVPPDLSFSDLSSSVPNDINPQFMLSSDGTQADFVPVSTAGNESPTVFIAPYDWGGWATLTVTATVSNLPPILGHFSGDTNTNIPVPKSQPGSVIADEWKILHNVPLSTPDTDDSENVPNGDGMPGDGLTLYEEYRGFYMGCTGSLSEPKPEGSSFCQHAEGDPTKKDFFVVDLIPTFADAGIRLFKGATGLNVHYLDMDLNDVGAKDPMNPGAYRVINFNNLGQPLHVVDQHAVVIGWGTTAGDSVAIGGPGLPKDIDPIEMSLTFSPQGQKGFLDKKELNDTVAHELSHSVNVWHHGDNIDHYELWTADPNNTPYGILATPLDSDTGAPTGPPSPIAVFEEDGDPLDPTGDLPHRLGPAALSIGSKGRTIFVGNLVCKGNVVWQGQSSGDQQDYMTYDSAEAYIPFGEFGDPTYVRYYTGVQQVGEELTNHPAGTGDNLSGRYPRVRFGDADTTTDSAHPRGNDLSQIDVNDAHTAIARGSFQCK